MSHRRLPTTVGQTLWPLAASAFTRLRRLRVVHNSGCIGSPRVVGSTKLLRSARRVGSSDDFFFRPAPGLRTRPDGAETWSRMSESRSSTCRTLRSYHPIWTRPQHPHDVFL